MRKREQVCEQLDTFIHDELKYSLYAKANSVDLDILIGRGLREKSLSLLMAQLRYALSIIEIEEIR